MKEISIIGVDLAKNVFQLHGAAADGSFMICAFRGMWALISRDGGHAFHAIMGSLTDVFMGSDWSGLVKGFRDCAPASEAFT
jgi:hypothetical protein